MIELARERRYQGDKFCARLQMYFFQALRSSNISDAFHGVQYELINETRRRSIYTMTAQLLEFTLHYRLRVLVSVRLEACW